MKRQEIIHGKTSWTLYKDMERDLKIVFNSF